MFGVTLIYVAVLTFVLNICYRLWKRLSFSPLSEIPIVPFDSFFMGFTKFRQEKTMVGMFEKLGLIFQGKCYGQNILFVADPKIARIALKEVKGKGFFHNANKKLNALSTFSLDTGPEWQLRRSNFRRAFSTVCLRTHVAIISSMTERLRSVLNAAALESETIKFDDLFTELTIGVICEVAFDMDSQAFEKGSSQISYINNLLKDLFKV